MNCSELIASMIPVRHCFLLPGGGNAPLVEAFADRAIAMLHEHSCAVAAEAYAQLTGLGLCLVTTGPGVTNAMTGLSAAWLDSTPLMLLSGQVKTQYMAGSSGCRQRGFQELPNTELTAAVTKYAATIVEPMDVRFCVGKALHAMTDGRQGPAHIDVPLDVQVAAADESMQAMVNGKQQVGDAAEAAQHAAELLRKAERPVLLIGHGARCDGLRELIEAIGLPTMLTWRAADVLEEAHPLFCGRPGIAGQRGANVIQQKADLLICVGARLDLGQTGYDVSLFASDAKKLVIDIDEAEARKHNASVAYVEWTGGNVDRQKRGWDYRACDGPEFLQRLNELQLMPRDRRPAGYGEWMKHCCDTYFKNRPRNAFYDQLSELLRPDDVIVCGSSGTAAESTLQHIKIKRGQRLVFGPGLGSMGFGLPAAIGAAVATGRRVICIEGDGSFVMNSYELETVRRLGLPIKVFVIRNDGYASIVSSQRRAGYRECVPSVPKLGDLRRFFEVSVWEELHMLPIILMANGPAVIAVDVDCSLSHRMRTVPPGKPEDIEVLR